MCGIVGLFGDAEGLGARVHAMAASLRHRGPDALGVWEDVLAGVGLGHTRLSIVDLSPTGAQPMRSHSGRYILTYNGELYNADTLRAELARSAILVPWQGHSDTEVLLACIDAWGLEKTLCQIEGMFAFGLWDRQNRTLHLARDRLGEKPLYYGWAGGMFAFASELKAFRQLEAFDAAIDRDAVAKYMRFGYLPSPTSIYRDVRKLLPASSITITPGERAGRNWPTPAVYWNAQEIAAAGAADPIDSDDEACVALEAVLLKAVKSQMHADVPLGAFLSGGVDSSAIVALMQAQASQPVKTFTVGFDESGYDESPHAAAVAKHLGTEHHEMRVSGSDALALIPRLPALYDEPFGDSSQIPTFLICQSARQHVAVALSGDAGDELFGGYNRYFWSRKIWNKARLMPFSARRLVGAAMTSVPISVWDHVPGLAQRVPRPGDRAHKAGQMLRTGRSIDSFYRNLVTHWPVENPVVIGAKFPASFIDDEVGLSKQFEDAEHRMMFSDMMTYLPDDVLVKVDRAAMGTSLETRAPFLDRHVVELAWRLSLGMKIRNGVGKWALRQVLYRYVPKRLMERPKAGFSVPIRSWLKGPLREWGEDLLSKRSIEDFGLLDAVQVRLRWQEHQSGRRDWSNQLWIVLMLQAWLRHSENPARV